MPNSPISTSGLNRNPQNIYIYSSGYDPAPSLTSNYFSIFEIASIKETDNAVFGYHGVAIVANGISSIKALQTENSLNETETRPSDFSAGADSTLL